jgi:aerobic-type carbon monoxide dehydrogenase small subunit (CoxS/CutS family)
MFWARLRWARKQWFEVRIAQTDHQLRQIFAGKKSRSILDSQFFHKTRRGCDLGLNRNCAVHKRRY